MDVYVLNTKFETIGIVDSYESFIWTDRFDEYGDFEIMLSPYSQIMDYLIPGNYLWRKDSDHVMIIKTIRIKTSSVESPEAYVIGESLESILKNRVIDSQTILNDTLQNGIEKLLNSTIISPSLSARKIPNFIFKASSDRRITSLKLNAQYFGENLYDVISDLCYSEHIGFKVTLNDKNQFVFELYAGTDRSYDQTDNPYVIFSPHYDNLLNSEYLFDVTNVKNVAYICGEEQDEEEKESGEIVIHPQVVTSTGDATGLGRKEIFVDGSSLKMSYRTDDGKTIYFSTSEYKDQLIQKGKEELAEYYADENFNGQVANGVQWTIGVDFFMGDIVEIENEYGQSSKSRIVEIITSEDTSGLTFYPSFEAIDSKNSPG